MQNIIEVNGIEQSIKHLLLNNFRIDKAFITDEIRFPCVSLGIVLDYYKLYFIEGLYPYIQNIAIRYPEIQQHIEYVYSFLHSISNEQVLNGSHYASQEYLQYLFYCSSIIHNKLQQRAGGKSVPGKYAKFFMILSAKFVFLTVRTSPNAKGEYDVIQNVKTFGSGQISVYFLDYNSNILGLYSSQSPITVTDFGKNFGQLLFSCGHELATNSQQSEKFNMKKDQINYANINCSVCSSRLYREDMGTVRLSKQKATNSIYCEFDHQVSTCAKCQFCHIGTMCYQQSSTYKAQNDCSLCFFIHTTTLTYLHNKY